MPRYRYGARRTPKPTVVEPTPEPSESAPTYRELQEEAKDLGVPANLNREELEAGIEAKKADDDD